MWRALQRKLFFSRVFQRGFFNQDLLFNHLNSLNNFMSEITRYSQLVMPQDANTFGTLFGGKMVSWMDIAASKAVHRFLYDTEIDAALTRAIDTIEFKETVLVGDWVSFEAMITKTGSSSIFIKIDAYKESRKSAKTLACTAIFTFVSVKKLKNGSYVKINHNKQP